MEAFTDQTYGLIRDSTVSLNNYVLDFQRVYEGMDNDTLSNIDRLSSLSQMDIEEFLSDSQRRQDIVDASGNVIQYMRDICDKNQSMLDEVDGLRGNYSFLFSLTDSFINDTYLGEFLGDLRNLTAGYSTNFLDAYRRSDFCLPVNAEIEANLTKVTDELPYFDVLFGLKKKLLKVNSQSKEKVSTLMSDLIKILKNRYRIYNQDDFNNYIVKANK